MSSENELNEPKKTTPEDKLSISKGSEPLDELSEMELEDVAGGASTITTSTSWAR